MPTTFKKLDVRPLIAQGMEPLSAILSKIELIRRGRRTDGHRSVPAFAVD